MEPVSVVRDTRSKNKVHAQIHKSYSNIYTVVAPILQQFIHIKPDKPNPTNMMRWENILHHCLTGRHGSL